MQNASLDDSQAGTKIAGRNINGFRYAGGHKVTDVEAPSLSHLSYLAVLTPDVDLYQHMVSSWEFTSKKNTDFTKDPF